MEEFRSCWEFIGVEAGSNTSTATLRVVGGDENRSLKFETVKYETRTRERLRWRRPAAYTKDRPILSSEKAPHKNDRNCQTVINIWSWAPDGGRHQDLLTDWPTVSRNVTSTSTGGSRIECWVDFGTPACRNMSLGAEELNWVYNDGKKAIRQCKEDFMCDLKCQWDCHKSVARIRLVTTENPI
jgi:hypothetical protein